MLGESHLNYCKIKFPYFLSRQKATTVDTHTHPHRHRRIQSMKICNIHFTCCDSQRKSTGQLSWFRHWATGNATGSGREIAPVARPLVPYIIISAPKRLIWVWRTFRLRFDCSKVRNDRPPPPARAVGRPWHHKLQTDSRLPLQRRRQLRSEGDSDSIGRHASATASFFDANPMGFSFTASAKGVCQCRVESSRVESESESESGWTTLGRAPVKLDAICVQLGYANLPEPCQLC